MLATMAAFVAAVVVAVPAGAVGAPRAIMRADRQLLVAPRLRAPVADAPSVSGQWYAVALGASLAAGTGASQLSLDYVNRVAAAEARTYPGLTVVNVSCGGDTVYAVLHGDHCRPPGMTQLAAALNTLKAHAGHVAYITIDIGADEVLPCIKGVTVNEGCVASALSEVSQNLPIVLGSLEAAAPGVPIVGAVYYDPELYTWLLGSAGQAAAKGDVALLASFNGVLERIYAASGIPVANWQAAFDAQDLFQQTTLNGKAVPLAVARTCEWTHECDAGHIGQNVHTNDAGYAVLALAVEGVLARVRAGSSSPGATWLASGSGGVFALGGARFYGSMGGKPLNAPVVGIAATPDGNGYWLVAADGGVFAFGDARFYGSMGGRKLTRPIVGITPAPSGNGYWLVAADGGVFAFGGARFFGSTGSMSLVAPVVSLAASPDGNGYWLVAADGGVFAFGDARFFGSLGGVNLAKPVVGAAASPDGNGYWLVASDGGVFVFGDAGFHGSAASMHLAAPVVSVVPSLSGNGYWLVAADGGVFAFGGAQFAGSLAGGALSGQVVAATAP